ncbi:hypothetical protein LS482_08545 [Sinomicrobium kalidii]|uniref:hypothetical protein n=1 Tax=Sinomicrobium kalidii TaxID=2900738 RepID=UPI001E613320|nr:hypothetical protein [Sinomicrobium kalidii]UGU17915.1 hypothetical protein LS482_08545 [Sinomicrobium kalidii]
MKIVKASIIKSKIKRSGVEFVDTYLFDSKDLVNNLGHNIFLHPDEEVIMQYQKEQIRWGLTNMRLILPNKLNQIVLEEITGVDFEKIKNEESTKFNNQTIDLHLRNGNRFTLNVEKGTWHLIFEIFKYIINYKTA